VPDRSLPLEYQDTILVSPVTADLFNGSKAALTVEQFVAPRHRDSSARHGDMIPESFRREASI
jgi:hypothetical protein